MVRFVATPQIQALIREYNAAIATKGEEVPNGRLEEAYESIEHRQLAQIASTLQKKYPSRSSQYSLQSLLKMTSLYLEPPPKPKPVYTSKCCLLMPRIQNIKLEWRL
jgi:hypothetical protein